MFLSFQYWQESQIKIPLQAGQRHGHIVPCLRRQALGQGPGGARGNAGSAVAGKWGSEPGGCWGAGEGWGGRAPRSEGPLLKHEKPPQAQPELSCLLSPTEALISILSPPSQALKAKMQIHREETRRRLQKLEQYPKKEESRFLFQHNDAAPGPSQRQAASCRPPPQHSSFHPTHN